MRKLIVICGPTASGKSELAVRLSRLIGGEVVSCDSMQLYRGMDIGTATPTEAEMGGVPHHLLSVLEPGTPCSAAAYRKLALPVIEEIRERGKAPVLCGGSGLYIDALTRPMGFSVEGDPQIRRQLEGQDREQLHRRLQSVDPESAARLHVNDVRRVVRALEIYLLTGETLSSHMARDQGGTGDFEGLLLAPDWPRELLYQRIERRVDQMMAAGLIQEVEKLLKGGLRPGDTAMQAIGYKELAACLNGECTLEMAVEAIKRGTRHYAKRQLTWLRRDPRVHWLPAQDRGSDELAAQAARIIKSEGEREEA